MSEGKNAIAAAFDEVNKLIADERKMNDERYEALEKHDEARAKEIDGQLEKIGTEIIEAQQKVREEERKYTLLAERVDILEATNDRPGKTVEEKAADAYKETFFTALRSKFKDGEKNMVMSQAWKKLQETKTVQIGDDTLGGHGVPEEISRQIDDLMLQQSDILRVLNLKTVGTSDYKELISINQTTSAWAAELGTRSQQTDPNLRQIAPTMEIGRAHV